MTDTTITFQDGYSDRSFTLPVNHRNWNREYKDGRIVDIMLVRQAHIALPMQLTMQIKSDGSVILAGTEWTRTDNMYWHYSQGPSRYENYKEVFLPITAEQERTIALLWADKSDLIESIDPLLPKALRRGIGASPQQVLSRSVVEIIESLSLPVPFLA
jgi:hypothetical protein